MHEGGGLPLQTLQLLFPNDYLHICKISSRCDFTSQLAAETIRRTCVKFLLRSMPSELPIPCLMHFPPKLKEHRDMARLAFLTLPVHIHCFCHVYLLFCWLT